jgi:hypothetical protein
MADALLEQILKGIKDDRLLNTHRPGPSPLNDLIEVYKERSAHDDNLPNLDEYSTGRTLKDGIAAMDADDQVMLLNQYAMATKGLRVPPAVKTETPATSVAPVVATPDTATSGDDPEDKKFKRRALMIVIVTGALCFAMLFGAVTAIAVRTGRAPSNELVSTFLESATEIAKLIFSKGGGE